MFTRISFASFLQSSRLSARPSTVGRFISSHQTEVVETEYGPIKGDQRSSVLGRKYFNFQGVPYMKSPVGKLRFRDAEPPAKWTEPLDVTKDPPGYCMRQFLNYNDGGQEDAAIVNIYTPYTNPKKPLPVMFWIHGGGWNSGSGQTDLFGPDYLMQQDVVLVTVNYRLGPVGFLSLDDPELNIPGNAGLKDQTYALKWVQRNISNFGGDPNNVTVFGESAGGGSTHYHMISNHSKGLFHKAIPMSGNAFCKAWSQVPRYDWALKLAKQLGYTGHINDKEILEFLEKPDGAAIVQATKKVLSFEQEIGLHILYAFGPTIEPYVTENCFIPDDPVRMARNAWSKDMDMMIGATSNEGILRVNCDADKISKLLQDSKYFAPVVQLGIDLNSQKAEEYGKKLKELYYGQSTPSVNNQQPYLDFIADIYFWHGIDRVLRSRNSTGGSGKTFLYRFDVDLSQNFVKKSHVKSNELGKYPGASHCDELSYLFKTGPDTRIPSPTIDSKEFETIKMMTETFTTFAATGDPNNSTIDGWKEFNLKDVPMRCLNFKEDDTKMIDLPEEKRMKVWSEIFAKEKVEQY